MAHGAEHDQRHSRHHQVTVALIPDPIGFRKFHPLLPFKGLLPVLAFKAKPPRRITPHNADRRGLCWLVVEESYLLVKGDRGGRGLHRRGGLRPVYHRLKV